MATLISDISLLVNATESYELLRGKALSNLPCIENAFVIVEGKEIAQYGKMADLKIDKRSFKENFDATGRMVLPSWCDSHSHIVFAGDRQPEFVDKIKGLSYEAIAQKGGGILNSAKLLAETSEDELFRLAYGRLMEVAKMGTGALEIKSGYGLSKESELKMLRVIRRLKNTSSVTIKASFLGAHALPAEFAHDRQAYIQMMLDLIPQIAAEDLASYIDVFCEKGFFSNEETEQICRAGLAYGLKPKIHANQLSCSGAVQTGVGIPALSVDHLERMDEASIASLAKSEVIGTMLPAAAFFLGLPYPPARKMIDAGCALTLASDYNPGSCPSGNMNFVVALACITMKMLPEEAIAAATINGAYAMETETQNGSITQGKLANLMITRPAASLAYIPYSFGNNLPSQVMLCGEWL